jgi:CRISP-associated protein Cas1
MPPPIHSTRYIVDEMSRYSPLADAAMTESDALVLNGHNCGLKVRNKALHIRPGTLTGTERSDIVFYKGVAPVRLIVILSHSGSISIEAFRWCKEQNISILLLDGLGNLTYSLLPEPESNAKLRRCQYLADDTGMGPYIARELIRKKALAQIDTLMAMGQRRSSNPKYRSIPILRGKLQWEYIQDSLPELDATRDVDTMRLVEARMALAYWDAFIGIPIQWQARDAEAVPPHWKAVTDRPSSASSGSPRKAICPFHAALNYLYGVAEHMILCAIHTYGLDPACGFLHYDKGLRDSLAFDLIEPHRPEVDALALGFFQKTVLRAGDVILLPSGQIMFNPEFLRYMLSACILDGKRISDTVSWLRSELLR